MHLYTKVLKFWQLRTHFVMFITRTSTTLFPTYCGLKITFLYNVQNIKSNLQDPNQKYKKFYRLIYKTDSALKSLVLVFTFIQTSCFHNPFCCFTISLLFHFNFSINYLILRKYLPKCFLSYSHYYDSENEKLYEKKNLIWYNKFCKVMHVILLHIVPTFSIKCSELSRIYTVGTRTKIFLPTLKAIYQNYNIINYM